MTWYPSVPARACKDVEKTSKMASFEGFDHIDCRVRSLEAVEAFYDALMPELGLPNKRRSYVDDAGNWHQISGDHRYNAFEFYEPQRPGSMPFFIGFVERENHKPGLTRIAFRVRRDRLFELETLLAQIGGCNIERSDDLNAYPAIFFEDPSGTKLEIVSRAASIAAG